MIDKIIENAMAAYMPRLAKLREERAAELASLKEKVRSNPEEVEEWFDREIEKLGKMDANFLKDATAGI